MDIEEKVLKIIKEYEAPEEIEKILIDFLLHAGNVYPIIDLKDELRCH